MSYGEISLEHTFDAGHRIVGHKGKCARLHGHTYKIHVLARGEVLDPGFVVDFGDIKGLVDEWDHRFLFWDQDPILEDMLGFMDPEGLDVHGIKILQFNPTAENMAEYLAKEIYASFALMGVLVELWETPKAMARYAI